MSWNDIRRSALDAVGETPMVSLHRMFDPSEGEVLAKLELQNPCGSKKDRVARQVLSDAVMEGLLKPHQTVVDASGGYTAVGMAMACAVRGHPFVAVTPRTSPESLIQAVRAFGGELAFFETDTSSGQRTEEYEANSREILEVVLTGRGAFHADPFSSVANFRAHRVGTGMEILRQTGGEFDVFCDFVGSAGTLAGCSAAFKEELNGIACYAVEPEGASVLAGEEVSASRHGILGGGFARPDLGLLQYASIDGYVSVTQEEAEKEVRRLARREGILGGWSTGATLAGARKLLKDKCAGQRLVVVLPDSGGMELSLAPWAEAA